MSLKRVVVSGVNTNDLKVFTNAEMDELMKKVKAGDSLARKEFINGNLKLVLSIVKKFSNRGEDTDDLFQVGCIGLIKAIDNFDLSHNVRFSTYAVPMIIGEIRRYLRDNNQLRVSRSFKDRAYKALQAREELTKLLERDPTTEEIAKHIGEEEIDVIISLNAIADPISIFEPVSNDGGDSLYLYDQIQDKKNLPESWDTELLLEEGILTLKAKEKEIVNMRFYQGKTQMEVAEEIGISQAQVSRIEKSAVSHLKKYL